MSEPDLSPELFEGRVTRLRRALYASLVVNGVLLIGGIVFWHTEATALFTLSAFPKAKEVPLAVYHAPQSLQEAFQTVETKSFPELVLLFTDKSVISDGIHMRDVALSQAISQYDFNIDKALGTCCEKENLLLQHREVVLARSLSDENFVRLQQFAESEKYPFTSKGIVSLLIKDPDNLELKKACTLLPEYSVFETLFKRVYKATSFENVMLFATVPFADVTALYEEEKKGLELHEEVARKLLVKGIRSNSKGAALFLLEHDAKYALHQMEDNDLIKLLQLLDDKEVTKKVSEILLKSNRRASVKQVAATNLSKNTNVKKGQPPLQVAPQVAMDAKKAHVPTPPLVEKKRVRYVVQGGDTLFRISKRFHVEIGAIKATNHLQNEQLKPGSILEIPVARNSK